MSYCLGIDIGSTSTELVVIDKKTKEICFMDTSLTGVNLNHTANQLLDLACMHLNSERCNFERIVATGYGRKYFKDDLIAKTAITEITCYAKAAFYLDSSIRTVIDIGGQDSKVISLDYEGNVNNFLMNDKCAAGTGKFLEMIAAQFSLSLDKLGVLSKNSRKTVLISNVCAVFAQSEIVNLISRGAAYEDIIKSAELSISSRIKGMTDQLGLTNNVMFCGGVAHNQGMIKSLSDILGCALIVPKSPAFVGALGAALLAGTTA